jgi:uncharacterized membrane protein YgdD (TMEM256/DUF423 family)
MHKRFIQIASLFGALSVILGAFGAHALKHILSPNTLDIYDIAVQYQFYHVLALLFVGLLYKDYSNNLLRWSGNLFISGIFLFSGSLYLLTYFQANNITGYSRIGAITPIGGICFITGWLLLALATIKKM